MALENQNAGELPRHLPALDGLRGLAALLILLTHIPVFVFATGASKAILVSLYIGVDFFFVLSGFLLFLPVAAGGGEVGGKRAFYLRRAARILPAYYFSLLVVIAFNRYFTTSGLPMPGDSAKGFFSLIGHLFLVQHEIFPDMEGFGANPVLWTLSVEVLFYAALPLVAGWYYRKPFMGLVIALAVSSAWKLFATHASFTLNSLQPGNLAATRIWLAFQIPTYLAHFAMGMTAAWLFVKIRREASAKLALRAAPVVQIAAVGGIVYAMYLAGTRQLSGREGLLEHATKTTGRAALFSLFLLATVLAPRWSHWPLSNRIARGFGQISYGIYLYHLPIIGLAFTTFGFSPYFTGPDASGAVLKMLAVAGPAAILAGWLSHVLLERPIYLRAKTAGRRPKAIPAPSLPGEVIPAILLAPPAAVSADDI